MALGPKAMGEAILANLKKKTGKDLAAWRAELERAHITDRDEAKKHLRERGLGQFQALAVVEEVISSNPYDDERRLVVGHFARYPEQRALYDAAAKRLATAGWTPRPCRGYLPIYRGGLIAVSFKATGRGLYVAGNLARPSEWPDRVAHKPSLGGSVRLKDGLYVSDLTALARILDGLA